MKQLKDIDVFLIGGQSNAVGCTKISTLPPDFVPETFERAMLYQEGNFGPEYYGKWVEGIHLGMGCNSSEMGIEYGIASVLNEAYAEQFALLRYAMGGSSLIVDWYPRTLWEFEPSHFIAHRGYCYRAWSETVTKGLNRLIEAGYRPHVKAFVWMQGEADSDLQHGAVRYQENLRALVDCVRAELRDPQLPVVIGEIATETSKHPWSDMVRAAQRQVAEEDENIYLVTTKDIPIGTDGAHFDGISDLRLGKRFGEVLKTIAKETMR